MIERNVVDAKDANNSHLFITIDRILQNINGRSSNGIVVGPEFSRMMAEILLQHIDNEILLELEKDGIFYKVDYTAFRYVDDIFLFSNQPQVLEQVLSKYKTIGEHYRLRINELKLTKGTTPCLPKEWLEKTRQLSDIIGDFFYQGKKSDYENLPEEDRYIVKNDFLSVDRIKDEIAVLVKKYPDDRRTIVSFLLSTLLNNISKKKSGYTLFGKKRLGKALLLLDIALYIYAFYPSFDQTRKVISIVAYLNSEVDFKHEEKAKEKLSNTINRYSFIFQSGNIHDLCDWMPFFHEYDIELDTTTECALIEKASKSNDPIIWANLLLYSQYYKPFFRELLGKIEAVVTKQLSKISDKDPMMQEEFWYVLIFHNCPYISVELRTKMSSLIQDIRRRAANKNSNPSNRVIQLICDFLERSSSSGNKPEESLFNWKGVKNFSAQITYRTYQRTVFKRYRKNTYGLYASID